jgi:pyridoxamine 5'-phosphate oxidase
MQNIAAIRKEYQQQTLLERDVDPHPLVQFNKWWEEALKCELDEVNAMTLATASASGIPSARIVLLKGVNEKGFTFYTNYDSHKGRELAENPNACLVFFWAGLERQVRIEGSVEKVSEAESDEYFASRPEGSRIGAWASPQSQAISSRAEIEENAQKYMKQFNAGSIPRPPHWGGYLVKPAGIEFWQGRPSRLHDRIQYTLLDNGAWKINRLAP